jgi:alpha-1,2-mannosyltransferase
MASRVGELPLGLREDAIPPRSRPRLLAFEPLWLWVLGSASTAVLVISALRYSANKPEMDFQVYRMGGRHIFGSGLYSSEVEVLGRHLSFTYPPFAALLFWPLSHLSAVTGQVLWDALNLGALIALIALSISAARSRRMVASDWRAALLLVTPIALLMFPVRSDLALGQVNILLILMIVADLTTGLTWRGRSFPHGVLLGVAAAIKLTPLVFIPYLMVSRQWRAARNATLTFVLTTGAMFVVSPHASWLYFTKDAFDVNRVGNSLSVGNQALHAAIMRAHLSPGAVLFDLIEAAVLCVGVAIATMAFRRSSKLLAVLVCAATGLLLSPISWPHHYVWIVPAVIWLAIGVDRPARGEWWAVVAGLTFLVVLPDAPGGTGPLWFVRDDAYVITTLVFIGLVGMMLWSRRNAHSGRQAGRADRPELPLSSEPRHGISATMAGGDPPFWSTAVSRRVAREPIRLDRV